jgi:hypothetical protein
MNHCLDKCCGLNPVQYVPAYWGNLKLSPDAGYSIECKECGRAAFGDLPGEARDKWNSIDSSVNHTENHMFESMDYEDLIKRSEATTKAIIGDDDSAGNFSAGMHGCLQAHLKNAVNRHNLLLKLYNEKREEFNKLMESTQ